MQGHYEGGDEALLALRDRVLADAIQADNLRGTYTLLLVVPHGRVTFLWAGIENWDLVEDGNEFLGTLHRMELG